MSDKYRYGGREGEYGDTSLNDLARPVTTTHTCIYVVLANYLTNPLLLMQTGDPMIFTHLSIAVPEGSRLPMVMAHDNCSVTSIGAVRFFEDTTCAVQCEGTPLVV